MSDTVEKVLPRALESPDPIVRNIAIRREELLREQVMLDNFLSAYAVLSSGQPISAVKALTRPAPPPARPVPIDFGVEAVKIITAHGRPMTFGEFRTAWCAGFGVEPEQNIRKRLKRLDTIVTIEGHGLWPTNMAVPVADNGVGDGAH
jgi:hypothetical protein